MNKKTGSLLGLVLALAVGTQAQTNIIVQWGLPSGDTNISKMIMPFTNVPTSYTPGTQSNPTVGENYYPNTTSKSPIFNATANNSAPLK